MKSVKRIFLGLLVAAALAGCSVGATPAATAPAQITQNQAVQATASSKPTVIISSTATPAVQATATSVMAENSKPVETTGDQVYDAAAAVQITLQGGAIQSSSAEVTIEGSTATITAPGTYVLSGTLDDGQIIVNTKSKEMVQLVLNGVDIQSSDSAPIYIAAAEKTVIVLADQTENNLTDGKTYNFAVPADEEPAAALFSKGDLVITGNGSLTVTANFRDGISSKDGLTIDGGSLTVTAVDDGIRGKDYLVIREAKIAVAAQGDGLKSDNQEDAAKGYIDIESGTIQVSAGGDAINAQSDVIIADGAFEIISGGGSSKSAAQDISAKGIKGVASVTIDGGTFKMSSADDTIHSNGSITVNGGTFELSTGDDGMHADNTLTINNGVVNISQSYEGLESAVITINGGDIQVVSSDDGVNVASGVDGSGGMAPRPGGGAGQDFFSYSGQYLLYIHGGRLYVNANGDGIDVNGAIEMTGGLVIVSGPTAQNNGALDYDAGFNMAGGVVVAAGSSGMAMAPGQSSQQLSVLIYLTALQPAGTLVRVENSSGEEVVTFAPDKPFQSIAISSPKLVQGTTYTVYTGGSVSGTAQTGYYEGGSYTAGTKVGTFTPSSTVTTLGSGGRSGGGRRP